MKIHLLVSALLLGLLTTSCNPSAATKQKIKDLEEQIASQESDIRTLTDEITRVTPKPGSLNPEAAKQLQDKCTTLQEQVTKLARMESEFERLSRENTSLRTQLDTTPKTTGTAGLLDSSGKILEKSTNAVIIIEGDAKSGTGFAVAVDGKKYVYTTAHILSGNTKLALRSSSGTPFTKFGALEAAEGADLVRMEILDEVNDPLALFAAGDGTVDGMEVGVLSKGITAENLIKGRVFASNGNLLEMDTLIPQHMSGAAVIDMHTGKVVGIVAQPVTTPVELFGQTNIDPASGGVAFRLNKSWEWKTLKIASFLAEGKAVKEYDDITKIGMAIAKLEINKGGVGAVNSGLNMGFVVGGSITILNVMEQYKDRPVVQAVMKMNAEMTAKKIPMNELDVKKKLKSVVNDIFAQVNRSGETLKPETFSWYNRNHAESSAKARKECVNSLNLALDQLK